ncbi:mast cell protease 4-like [Cyprinodon tularosa]|uniref:mast cell protease 4-like n=1 Tax=Cyprinodon tularosa TaxID=77115 RepID=UPI0018E1F792|nr:mast cell protease 4-like [Cyprinodon tularosa]
MRHTGGIIYVLLLITICGATESGITGGTVARPHSRPYMASLQIQGQHVCGGMLIRQDYVLTAAHCKDCYQDFTVVLGAHNISKKEESQQKIQVKKYHVHPQYKSKEEYEYDIMLLKLEKKAKLNQYVKTIALAKENEEINANLNCDVAGWGKKTSSDEKVSDLLREAKEKIQFSFECKNIWGKFFNSQLMICTKFWQGGVCQGDSGGPLICDTRVQGITAFTFKEKCDNRKYPHVFTKVHYFLPWIKEVMRA